MRLTAAILAWLFTNVALAIQPPTGAVIIPIDLEETVIRVVATCDHSPPEHVAVDVGFSQHLMRPPVKESTQPTSPKSMVVHTDEAMIGAIEAVAAATDDYTLIAERLRTGDEFHGVFESGISGAVVGIYLKRINRRDQVIVELRPMYVLPSGGKMPLTKSSGLRTLKHADQLLAQATAAKATVPKLQAAVRAAQVEYESESRTSGVTTARTLREYASDPTASARTAAIGQRWRNLARQLDRAQSLASRLSVLKRDAAATYAVAEYAASISADAAVYVRLYSGGDTLAAEVR